ncbi:transketolase [Patescibacteria group bacterium]|nr:transketolase [Patescibacteria group bacterium]MBU4453320.1 transketolase [Patescibacteria group bacterium]MCG2687409.1 transketolase [Candidatus Parcubacteria bacterium]
MPPVRDIKLLTEKKLLVLENKAQEIRADILKMLEHAGSGHSAGSLGMADVFTALYYHVLVHDPKHPNDKNRDRLILSCGHIAPVHYTTLAHAGYFPKTELQTLRKFGSRLQGHPELGKLPGIENTSGPLGDGSSQAVGMAYVAKQEKLPFHTYCIMSDGELQAGITWEAALFAGRNVLHNMTWIVDRNNIQIDGYTEDIMPIEPLVQKFEAFNFHVIEVDGHNIREIVEACAYAQSIFEQPTVIIAHTTPGKGVDFMEFEPIWHGKTPKDKAELNRALKALRTLNNKITTEGN